MDEWRFTFLEVKKGPCECRVKYSQHNLSATGIGGKSHHSLFLWYRLHRSVYWLPTLNVEVKWWTIWKIPRKGTGRIITSFMRRICDFLLCHCCWILNLLPLLHLMTVKADSRWRKGVPPYCQAKTPSPEMLYANDVLTSNFESSGKKKRICKAIHPRTKIEDSIPL